MFISTLLGWLSGLLSMLKRGSEKTNYWIEAKNLLREHEGLRLRPYKDSLGYVTIGYGRCLDTKPLTIEEAEYLFQNDFNDALLEVKANIPFFENLNYPRQVVLIDMCFNLGIKGLLGFKNTLRYIGEGNYEQAAKNMLKSKWATQVKNRAVTLSKMMETGEFVK